LSTYQSVATRRRFCAL